MEDNQEAVTKVLKEYVEETYRRQNDDIALTELFRLLTDNFPLTVANPLAKAVKTYLETMQYHIKAIDYKYLDPDEEPDTDDDDGIPF